MKLTFLRPRYHHEALLHKTVQEIYCRILRHVIVMTHHNTIDSLFNYAWKEREKYTPRGIFIPKLASKCYPLIHWSTKCASIGIESPHPNM